MPLTLSDGKDSNHGCPWGFEPGLVHQRWLRSGTRSFRIDSCAPTSAQRYARAPIWFVERALDAPFATDRSSNDSSTIEPVQSNGRTVGARGQPELNDTKLGQRLFLEASAGAIAEAFVEFLLYPLDTLKQTQQLPVAHRRFIHSRHALSSALAWRMAPGQQWLGPVRAFQLAIRRAADGRGFRQLYAGVLSGVVGSLPTAALFAITYESVRRAFCRWSARQHAAAATATAASNKDTHPWLFWESTAAAATANVVSSLIDTPAELIKQRVQSCLEPNIVAAMRHLWVHEGGFGALWTGYGSNLLRNLPFDALEFGTFEQMKRMLQRIRGRERLTEWELLLLGMSAGGLVGALTTPLDVVRTRMLGYQQRLLEKQ